MHVLLTLYIRTVHNNMIVIRARKGPDFFVRYAVTVPNPADVPNLNFKLWKFFVSLFSYLFLCKDATILIHYLYELLWFLLTLLVNFLGLGCKFCSYRITNNNIECLINGRGRTN